MSGAPDEAGVRIEERLSSLESSMETLLERLRRHLEICPASGDSEESES